MKQAGKKHRKAQEALLTKSTTTALDALKAIVALAHVKFDESVEAAVQLGIDAEKGEQTVRGAVPLPHGTGKKIRVLVFAKDDYVDQAKRAGADFVGLDDLVEKIQGGWCDFDVAVATPDLMGKLGSLAKILGPKGLLPNKKTGTVTFEIEEVVKQLKEGRVSYRNDKSGVVHVLFGKVSFGAEKLRDNLQVIIKAIAASRPPTAKGVFIRKISVSSTMGVGVFINPDEFA